MKICCLPILSLVLSFIFWIVDSAIDVHIFGEEESFIESAISPEPVELMMRVLVIVLLVSFAFYAKYLIKQEKKISDKLVQHKHELEEIVSSRTKELQDEIEVRKKAEDSLEELATTDPLTSAFNRRKFSAILNHEIERERRYKNGLFLMMCDLDNFKAINDKYGHNAGDMVLKKISLLIKNTIRKSDVFARWGGEEFIFLIPNTDADRAKDIAENLRKLIGDTAFETVGTVTASFGIAAFEENDDEDLLINRTDKALYRAKKNGRNVTELYSKS